MRSILLRCCFVLLLVVADLCIQVHSFHKCYHRNDRIRNAISNAIEVSSTKVLSFKDNQADSADLFPDGPGHTRKMPLSIADNSRMELAKIVVSTAILLLTFKIRFDDLLNSYGLQKDKKDEIERGMTVYSDGLRLEDLVMGTDEPSEGDKVVLNSKVFFSGLQIKAFNGGETIHNVIYGDRDSMTSAFGQLNFVRNDDKAISVQEKEDGTVLDVGTVMDRILGGLKMGGRRRIFLPAELAFSSRGLAPYVPPDTPVVLELSLYHLSPKDDGKNFWEITCAKTAPMERYGFLSFS
eukprot:gene28649-37630_t